MPRRRSAADEPRPGDRVRSLLAGSSAGGGWVPPPEEGAAEEPEADPSWAPSRRPPRTHAAAAGVRDLLPVGLATGRLDPGRRGAAALVAVGLVAALVAGAVVLRGRPQEVVVPDVVATGLPLPGASPSAEPTGTGSVVVAVGGKVVSPGLVRLPQGSRVDDAVRAAGGPLPGASTGLLNLARRLVDGELVVVGVAAPGAAPAAAGGGSAVGGLLDLNSAAVGDFDGLPGIGPVLAQRIVDWRTEHGRFASVEQLREVTGIGESKYADLKAKVTV